MSKDPAFLFYSNDFLTGVADLTFEERGQYITLLALQHQKGILTKKIIDVSVPNVSEDVLLKFTKDKDGNYYNKRLKEEAFKRSEHSRKQKERALNGWAKRKQKNTTNKPVEHTTADATALPLENVNKSVDKDQSIPSKKEIIEHVKSSLFALGTSLSMNETKDIARSFWDYYGSQGWRKANGMAITDYKLAVNQWVTKEINSRRKQYKPQEKVNYDPPREIQSAMNDLARKMKG